MKKTWLLLASLLLFFLTQCSSPPPTDQPLSTEALPILTNPARAKIWGPPSISQNANGYTSTYINPSNPKEKLRIIGSHKGMPFFVYPPNIKGLKTVNGIDTPSNEAQVWKKALVKGKTVKWYQSRFANSQQAAEYRTLATELNDQSGGKGQYRIEVEGTKNQMRTWLSELRFDF